MTARYDLAVVGSGFAGSLLAAIGKRLGLSVLLLERTRHPRFAIGESSTPLANLILEQLTSRYSLSSIAPLAKWGSWQDHYPQLACGLKRGFSFFHHTTGKKLSADSLHQDQLLVAASPHDRIADVHWYRSDFDKFLVEQAQLLGVDYLDSVQLDEAHEQRDGMTLLGTRNGAEVSFKAGFVVDATGPRGFLHKALQLHAIDLPKFPQTQALYTHFTGVRRLTEDIALEEEPSFPIDDAAVHHVFDGGWIWVLRFNNGITSAGVAALGSVADELRFEEGADAWFRLLSRFPSVKAQFADARPVRPFIHSKQVSFRSGTIAGKRWALLPSAAGFVDPLLSTGFPLTLLGIKRIAGILESGLNASDLAAQLSVYAQQTDNELLAASRLISALYANMGNFERFSDLSFLYFAAASYSETALRLAKPELATSFLLHDHPQFGRASREVLDRACYPAADQVSNGLHDAVVRAIEPINIAGLANPQRRNWYPVDAEDLLVSAWKVDSSRAEVQALLDRSGFWN